MAYEGNVELISGVIPKNGGSFPLVDAHDIRVTDTQRLDEAISEKADKNSSELTGVTKIKDVLQIEDDGYVKDLCRLNNATKTKAFEIVGYEENTYIVSNLNDSGFEVYGPMNIPDVTGKKIFLRCGFNFENIATIDHIDIGQFGTLKFVVNYCFTNDVTPTFYPETLHPERSDANVPLYDLQDNRNLYYQRCGNLSYYINQGDRSKCFLYVMSESDSEDFTDFGIFDQCIYKYSFGKDNVTQGEMSLSLGENNVLNGKYSSAFGSGNVVGYDDTAFGRNNTIIGALDSIAFGLNNKIIGEFDAESAYPGIQQLTSSFAFGDSNIITSKRSGALGTSNVISGNGSIAIGTSNSVRGNNSIAIGKECVVNDDNIVKIGSVLEVSQFAADVHGELSANNVYTTSVKLSQDKTQFEPNEAPTVSYMKDAIQSSINVIPQAYFKLSRNFVPSICIPVAPFTNWNSDNKVVSVSSWRLAYEFTDGGYLKLGNGTTKYNAIVITFPDSLPSGDYTIMFDAYKESSSDTVHFKLTSNPNSSTAAKEDVWPDVTSTLSEKPVRIKHTFNSTSLGIDNVLYIYNVSTPEAIWYIRDLKIFRD